MAIGNIGDSPIPQSFVSLLQYSASGTLYNISGSEIVDLDIVPSFSITADLFPSPVDFTVSSSHTNNAGTTNFVTSVSAALNVLSSSYTQNSLFSISSSRSNTSNYALTSSLSLFTTQSTHSITASFINNLIPSASVILTASVISGSNNSFIQPISLGSGLSGYSLSASDVVLYRSKARTLSFITSNDPLVPGVSIIQSNRLLLSPESDSHDNTVLSNIRYFSSSAYSGVDISFPSINSNYSSFLISDQGIFFNGLNTSSFPPILSYNSFRTFEPSELYPFRGNHPMFVHRYRSYDSTGSIQYERTASIWFVEQIGRTPTSGNFGFRFLLNAGNLSQSNSNLGQLTSSTLGGFPGGVNAGIFSGMANGLTVRPPIGDNTSGFTTSQASQPMSHSAVIGSVIYNSREEVHLIAASGLGLFPYGYRNSSSNISQPQTVSINSTSSAFVDFRTGANSFYLHAISGSVNIARGNLVINRLGAGISIKENTPSSTMGTVTITNGTGSVSTTAVQSNSRIFFTRLTTGSGIISVGNRVVGDSFQVLSTIIENTSAAWFMIQPN